MDREHPNILKVKYSFLNCRYLMMHYTKNTKASFLKDLVWYLLSVLLTRAFLIQNLGLQISGLGDTVPSIRDATFCSLSFLGLLPHLQKKIWVSAFCSCAGGRGGVRVSLFQRVGIFCQSVFVQRSGAPRKAWHLDQTSSGFNLPLMILKSHGVLHMTS